MVLSLLDWPGYATDVGSLADPVDGYLVTVRPARVGAEGETVHVDFRPPGWTAEVAAWVLALVAGAGWSLFYAVRRRRAPGELAAAQPRARSVSTVWPLSLTKVSTSWRPWCRSGPSWPCPGRAGPPTRDSPGRILVADLWKVKAWTIESA